MAVIRKSHQYLRVLSLKIFVNILKLKPIIKVEVVKNPPRANVFNASLTSIVGPI